MPCLRFRHGFPQIADCFIHCPVEARFHVLYSFFHVDVRRNAHVIVAGSVQHEAFHGADAERPSARKLAHIGLPVGSCTVLADDDGTVLILHIGQKAFSSTGCICSHQHCHRLPESNGAFLYWYLSLVILRKEQ